MGVRVCYLIMFLIPFDSGFAYVTLQVTKPFAYGCVQHDKVPLNVRPVKSVHEWWEVFGMTTGRDTREIRRHGGGMIMCRM